jgi:hypothetical protein
LRDGGEQRFGELRRGLDFELVSAVNQQLRIFQSLHHRMVAFFDDSVRLLGRGWLSSDATVLNDSNDEALSVQLLADYPQKSTHFGLGHNLHQTETTFSGVGFQTYF